MRKHEAASPGGGAAWGGFWGLLFGMIFFVPFLGLAIGGDEETNRMADELAGAVAEHPLGGGVAGADDAVEILRDDRVVRRLDDGRQVRDLDLSVAVGGRVVSHPKGFPVLLAWRSNPN